MPQPGGDALVLLLQALEAGIKVAPGKAEIGFEVPMIEAAEAADLATTHDMGSAVPGRHDRAGPAGGSGPVAAAQERPASEARVTGGGQQEDGREPCAG